MKATALSMLRLFCILILILVIPILATGQTATEPTMGDGTSANPYHIRTLNNLYWIASSTANWDKHYIQIADIDASATSSWDSGSGWTSIGNQFNQFTGSYNGLGCTIDGLTIDRSSTSFVGFIGHTDGASVKNLGITNVDITGGYFTGTLIGVSGSSTVLNCYSSGTVTGVESVGGLVGWSAFGTIDNCYSSVTTTGTSEGGGLVGYNQEGSTITNCFSTGSVTRSSGTEVSFGGFCGHNDEATIDKSYSTGAVIYTGATDPTTKGFVGAETVTTSYSNNFFNSQTSSQSTGTGATAKTTTQMKTESTFTDAGWDFVGESTNGNDDYWDISGDYPFIYSPEGTENNPLKITSLADLVTLSSTSANWGKYIIQTADIDASATDDGGSGFLPIGISSPYFTGTYDGLGYTIDALFINRASTDYVAPFGRTDGAEITNLGLTNVDITGHYQVGGLVGWCASSTINKCFTTGSVSGSDAIGGLIGWYRQTLTLTNSYSRASVSGGTTVGGLMGTLFYGSSATVSNCYSTGAVSGTSSIGGLVGYDRNPTWSTVTNCFWDTQTSGQASSAAGTGKTTVEMKSSDLYLSFGWDFQDETDNGSNDYWTINSSDNTGYPALSWQGYSNSGLSYPCVSYLTTTAVTSITKTTAASGGNVISANGASVTARGVCWDTSTNPDINDSKTTDDSGTGSFTSSLTGLTSATTYYLRAYATNSAGTNYGDEFSFTTIYFNGSGTSGDPFTINNLTDLSYLAQHSYYWDQGYYFKQTADIDATQTQYWDDTDDDSDGDLYNDTNDGTSTGNNEGFIPIGLSGYFRGYYDGQGHKIDGLTINRGGTDYVGLFGYAYALVENLGLTNIDFTGGSWVGGIVPVGDDGTLVNKCYTSGSVIGNGYVGGICGQLMGPDWGDNRVTNSYSRASCSGNYLAGGLVGHVGGTVMTSYSIGSVIDLAGEADYIGGLIGRVGGYGTVSNSFWDTETSGQSGSGGGTGKTTTELKTLTTFTDEETTGLTTAWDFETNPNDDVANEDYWDIDFSGAVNDGYPYLSWQDGVDRSLPVELSLFTAEKRKTEVVLQWVTESEIENLGFILERRLKDGSTWMEIATYLTSPELQGHGSSTDAHQYEFTDKTARVDKIYEYCLNDVDYKGKVTRHPTILSQARNPLKFALGQTYPNPFNPQITIPVAIPEQAELILTIFDLKGREVQTLAHGKYVAGEYTLVWDGINAQGKAASAGVYFISCRMRSLETGNKHEFNRKIIKLD